MSTIQTFPLETPALRPLEIFPAMHQGRQILLVRDPMGILEGVAALMPDPILITILQSADGQTTVEEMASKVREQTGLIVTADRMRNVVRELDDMGLLMSDNLVRIWDARREAYGELPSRPSMLFNGEDRLLMIKQLKDELDRHAASNKAASIHSKLDLPGDSVRAVLSPHIDYERGGPIYTWAYKALAENTQARTFIILGTLHRPSTHPFIASKKTFETPFGDVEVDTEILDELADQFGGELYHDEFLHAGEHTIELQVVYLKHVMKGRPFKVVPILVSSFEHLLHVEGDVQPNDDEEIAAFTNALQSVMRRHEGEVVLIGGVDFAHCGPEFGDEEDNTEERMQAVRAQDEAMLRAIEEVDPAAFFDSFRGDLNARRVCSIAPIYCVLSAIEETHVGKVLAYDQANSEDKSCMVTFGSVAFVPKSRSKLIELPG